MSIWQTQSWQNMLKDSGQTSKYFLIDNVYIEKRSLGLGQFGFFVIGVSLTEIQTSVYKKIIDLSKKEKVLFVQFETIHYGAAIKNTFKKLKSSYYKKFITPYTCVIDLEKDTDTILSEMKPKGRYNIRLAEKKGVIVREVEKSDDNIKAFYNLMLDTTSRDGFNGNTFDFYKTFLLDIESSKLLIAYSEDIPIAGGIFTFNDNAIYYYGASTSDKKYRNLMAPYLLQWTAINVGKSLNCHFYDFLGVATPGNKKSSLLGVTDFKLKFTKDIRQVSESYLHINNILLFYVLIIIKSIKKILPF